MPLQVKHLRTIPGAYAMPFQASIICADQTPKRVGGALLAPPGFVAVLGRQPPLRGHRQEFRILDEEELKAHRILERIGYVSLPRCSMVVWRTLALTMTLTPNVTLTLSPN